MLLRTLYPCRLSPWGSSWFLIPAIACPSPCHTCKRQHWVPSSPLQPCPALAAGEWNRWWVTSLTLSNKKIMFNYKYLHKVIAVFNMFPLIIWKRDTHISHRLIHFPNSWGWARLKPQAWNSTLVSYMGVKDPTTVITACLPEYTWTGR